jgi:hypothetical protein
LQHGNSNGSNYNTYVGSGGNDKSNGGNDDSNDGSGGNCESDEGNGNLSSNGDSDCSGNGSNNGGGAAMTIKTTTVTAMAGCTYKNQLKGGNGNRDSDSYNDNADTNDSASTAAMSTTLPGGAWQ